MFYILLLQYLIHFTLLGIVEGGGTSWARILWAISTSLFGVTVVFRIIQFIRRQYSAIKESKLPLLSPSLCITDSLLDLDLSIGHRHRLIEFNIWTIVKVMDLYFSFDVMMANVFMTFWCKYFPLVNSFSI